MSSNDYGMTAYFNHKRAKAAHDGLKAQGEPDYQWDFPPIDVWVELAHEYNTNR